MYGNPFPMTISTDDAPFKKESITHDVLGMSLVALFIALLLYRAPLRESFWLDELVIVKTLSMPLREAFFASLSSQSQSPLYMLLLRAWTSIFGVSELAARSVSIIGILVACVFLVHSGRTIGIRRPYGLLILPFLSLEEVLLSLTSARPYAWALAIGSLSTVLWLRWLVDTRTKTLFFYLVSLTITFYFHYLFLLMVSAHAVLYLFSSSRPSLRGKGELLLLFLFSLLLIPGILHLLSWSSSATTSLTPFRPSLLSSIGAVIPRHFLVYLICSLILLSLFGKIALRELEVGRAVPYLVWWCCGPLLLIAASLVLQATLDVPRYFSWRSIGGALGVGVLVGRVVRTPRAYVSFACTWFYLASFLEASRHWEVERWRESAGIVTHLYDGIPVALCSGLREANAPKWLENREHLTIAQAPLTFYGYQGAPYLVGRGHPLPRRIEEVHRVLVYAVDPDNQPHEVCGAADGSDLYGDDWVINASHDRGLVKILYLHKK
jgi:uncharacterized membrane protein